MIWLRRGPQLSENSLFLWCKQFLCGFWIKLCPSTCGDNTVKQNYDFKDTNKTQLNHTSAETIWNLIRQAIFPNWWKQVLSFPLLLFMAPVKAVSWATWFNGTALIRGKSSLLRTLCHTHSLLTPAYTHTHTPSWLTAQLTEKQGGQMTVVRPLSRTYVFLFSLYNKSMVHKVPQRDVAWTWSKCCSSVV